MSLASVFDLLGHTIIPQIGAAVFPDTLNVVSSTVTAGTGGGQIKSASVNDYSGVPCAYEPERSGRRNDAAGRLLSQQSYTLTIPTHHSGSRVNIEPAKHLLEVAARGNEPAKTFRIVSIRDDSGVVFEAACIREN